MTLEEFSNLKIGDTYYRVFEDGDIDKYTISTYSLGVLSFDSDTENYRFITEGEAKEAATLLHIQRKLQQ